MWWIVGYWWVCCLLFGDCYDHLWGFFCVGFVVGFVWIGCWGSILRDWFGRVNMFGWLLFVLWDWMWGNGSCLWGDLDFVGLYGCAESVVVCRDFGWLVVKVFQEWSLSGRCIGLCKHCIYLFCRFRLWGLLLCDVVDWRIKYGWSDWWVVRCGGEVCQFVWVGECEFELGYVLCGWVGKW